MPTTKLTIFPFFLLLPLLVQTIALFTTYVFFFIPETRGLSLAQVDELYLTKVPAWRSASWTPYGSKEQGDDAQKLKLGAQSSHLEKVQRRDLADEA